jgi:hypothetical protein
MSNEETQGEDTEASSMLSTTIIDVWAHNFEEHMSEVQGLIETHSLVVLVVLSLARTRSSLGTL